MPGLRDLIRSGSGDRLWVHLSSAEFRRDAVVAR